MHGYLSLSNPHLLPLLLLLAMASPTDSTSSLAATNLFAMPNDRAPPPASTLMLLNIHTLPLCCSTSTAMFLHPLQGRRQLQAVDRDPSSSSPSRSLGLVSHVDGSVDAAAMFNDPEWLQVNSCIISWLYSTVSKDIWCDVYNPSASAYTT